jgi:hypothetical protein
MADFNSNTTGNRPVRTDKALTPAAWIAILIGIVVIALGVWSWAGKRNRDVGANRDTSSYGTGAGRRPATTRPDTTPQRDTTDQAAPNPTIPPRDVPPAGELPQNQNQNQNQNDMPQGTVPSQQP